MRLVKENVERFVSNDADASRLISQGFKPVKEPVKAVVHEPVEEAAPKTTAARRRRSTR